jgi:hypothetical protein
MIGIPMYVAELPHGCGVVQECGKALHMIFRVESTLCE